MKGSPSTRASCEPQLSSSAFFPNSQNWDFSSTATGEANTSLLLVQDATPSIPGIASPPCHHLPTATPGEECLTPVFCSSVTWVSLRVKRAGLGTHSISRASFKLTTQRVPHLVFHKRCRRSSEHGDKRKLSGDHRWYLYVFLYLPRPVLT